VIVSATTYVPLRSRTRTTTTSPATPFAASCSTRTRTPAERDVDAGGQLQSADSPGRQPYGLDSWTERSVGSSTNSTPGSWASSRVDTCAGRTTHRRFTNYRGPLVYARSRTPSEPGRSRRYRASFPRGRPPGEIRPCAERVSGGFFVVKTGQRRQFRDPVPSQMPSRCPPKPPAPCPRK